MGVEKKTITQENTGSATNPGKEVVIEEPVNESSVAAPTQTTDLSSEEIENLKTWQPDRVRLNRKKRAKDAWDKQQIAKGGGEISRRYFPDGTPAKYDAAIGAYTIDFERYYDEGGKKNMGQ